MTGLQNRVALVTGGSRGIGAATAISLAREGADVAVCYRSDEQAATTVVEQIRSSGRRAESYQGDVASADDCARIAERAVKDFSAIDIIISNAGNARTTGPVAESDIQDYLELFACHVLGPVHLCKLLVPQMRRAPRGDIVMVSSIAAHLTPGSSAPYNIAKVGLEALAHTLAKEERVHGIRVNVIVPGLVETELGARFARRRLGVTDMRELDAKSPFGHVCQPEDIANAIVFLCTDGGYITNQRIVIDGGGF